MGTLWQDIRYGFRMLTRNLAFTVVVVLILGLGIGATTAIFCVVHAVVLRPLPFKDGARLVMLWETDKKRGYDFILTRLELFSQWKQHSTCFEGISAMQRADALITDLEEPTRPCGVKVSAEFFSILGVKPQLGRVLLPGDEAGAGQPVVVLSHSLWQRLYGGDPGLVGKSVTLAGVSMSGEAQSYTVAGIMPAGFQFPHLLADSYAQFWVPFSQRELADRGEDLLVLAKLKRGVTLAQAQAQMETIAKRLAQERPDPRRPDRGVNVTTLHERVVRDVRLSLMLLLGAVTFLLLIACANVANLLLARSLARLREMAVRLSLGASRWRIVRQLLTESLLLAGLGGVMGLLLAFGGVRSFVALGGRVLPRVEEIGIDGQVLGFALGVSMVTGLIFGLVPALGVSGVRLNEFLKEGRAPFVLVGVRSGSLRRWFVVGEIALSLVLLTGTGLLVKSLIMARTVELGFNPRNVLAVRTNVAGSKEMQGLLERISSLPGVHSLGATTTLPISGNSYYREVWSLEGELPKQGSEEQRLYLQVCTADYFRAMGIAVLKGRGFGEQDRADSARVVIVNETLVKQFLGAEDPIGRQLTLVGYGRSQLRYTIVGVVRDIRHLGLDKEVYPEVFIPWGQHQQLLERPADLVIRGESDVRSLAGAIRAAIREVDRRMPIPSILPMEEVIQDSLLGRRFQVVLVGLFSCVGLILASAGIYGVVSYLVEQRTHEIGIRMAMGAEGGDVLRLVIGHGMRLTFIGVVVGFAGALALSRFLRSLLFQTSPTDPATFAAVFLLLGVVALAACYIPARRAAKIDPMAALRYE